MVQESDARLYADLLRCKLGMHIESEGALNLRLVGDALYTSGADGEGSEFCGRGGHAGGGTVAVVGHELVWQGDRWRKGLDLLIDWCGSVRRKLKWSLGLTLIFRPDWLA